MFSIRLDRRLGGVGVLEYTIGIYLYCEFVFFFVLASIP